MAANRSATGDSGQPPAIDLRGVTVTRSGRTILDEITWSVPAGGLAAVLGPNGSGKSTLVRVVLGQMWPTRGDVAVLGQPFGETDLNELRRDVRLVQTGGPLEADADESAERVVLTGFFGTVGLYHEPTAAQRARARELIRQVGLAREAAQPFRTLSSGERMRCLIARALVVAPKLLILDEPTNGLDLVSREQVLATVAALVGRAESRPAVVVITHHVEELMPQTAQVLVLKDGRAFASGPPSQVLTSAVLSGVYDLPVEVNERGGRFWLQVHPEAWRTLVTPG
jgi:iron complex transport system ATP-binding protein